MKETIEAIYPAIFPKLSNHGLHACVVFDLPTCIDNDAILAMAILTYVILYSYNQFRHDYRHNAVPLYDRMMANVKRLRLYSSAASRVLARMRKTEHWGWT